MNEQNLIFQEMLEWYLQAGVDEVCGDAPFSVSAKKNISSVPADGLGVRAALGGLSQSVSEAKKQAELACVDISSLEDLRHAVEVFDGCSLKQTSANLIFGAGSSQAKIAIVGEAPGSDEDRAGKPFVGKSGALLDAMLKSIGLSRETVYLSNILPWRPPGNRTPLDSEVSICMPFLKKQLDLVSPDIIIVLGISAFKHLLSVCDPISKARLKWFDYILLSGKVVKVCVSFHPAYLLCNPSQKSKSWADMQFLSARINDENS